MRSLATALSLPVACFIFSAQSQDYHFDASLLGEAAKGVDLSLFSQGLQQPGTYQLDIMLNDELVDSQNITLAVTKDADGRPILSPCLSVAQLSRWGVKTEAFPGLSKNPGDGACARLTAISQANVTADIVNQQLRLSIPQVALRPRFEGIAPENLWDDGITAFMMNYSAGISHTEYQGARNDKSSWVQIQPGFNTGAWRFRSALNRQSGGRWQRSYTYAQLSLKKLKSKLSLGERTTSGDVFDSLPFTGFMLETDSAMVPASERNFAPAVTGVARTRARVEVRQKGYLVKSLTVAPGPFAIQDLPAGSGGGDLLVTVYETDGRKQVFIVPWQTPAIALHQGYLKYSMTAGRYRPARGAMEQAPVGQATVMYGLPHNLTIYGGYQGAAHYGAASLGVGSMLGRWGAVSVDATGAQSQSPNVATRQGVSWRARYSNHLALTNTGFTLASVQYASPGYRSLSETLDTWQKGNRTTAMYHSFQQRSRNTLSLSQPLGPLGSIGINASRTYWRGDRRHEDGYGLGWSTSVRGTSVSVNWQQNIARANGKDSTLTLWLSMPLDSSTNASWNMNSPSRGRQMQEAGLSGRALENQMTWDVRERYSAGSPSNTRSNSSLHLGWNGAYGQAGMDYGYNPAGSRAAVNVSGGILIHQHGITLSQPLSETVALVSAPGVKGLKVNSGSGIRTDWRGYTTTSELSSYQENTVSLSSTDIPDDAEVQQTDVKVVPTTGAVVEAAFRVRTGARVLMTLRYPDGTFVPFGSQVTLKGSVGSAGLVDGNGLAYLTGLAPHGTLSIRTGNNSCLTDYRLPDKKGPSGLYEMNTVCRLVESTGG